MTDAGPMVEFRDVSFAFAKSPILSELDLSIDSGEILVLLGESGCGKTTTLKLINRLIEPTLGAVWVKGRPAAEWDAIDLRRHIGYVLQEGGLFPHFTVRENVALTPSLLGWDKRRQAKRSDEMLSLVNLDPERFRDRFPHELSGGQRQRVGVARALAGDPDLLLLDEPFGALDALNRAALQKEFVSLVRSMDKTAVFVTHDLHEAMMLGTRIALMEKGRIVFLGTPDEFSSSQQPLASRYLETIRV